MTPAEIKEWRASLKLTQVRAAAFLGVSRISYARYETVGKIPKPIELLCKLTKRD